MLNGLMAELSIGLTDFLSTDVGPMIRAEAIDMMEDHIAAMAGKYSGPRFMFSSSTEPRLAS